MAVSAWRCLCRSGLCGNKFNVGKFRNTRKSTKRIGLGSKITAKTARRLIRDPLRKSTLGLIAASARSLPSISQPNLELESPDEQFDAVIQQAKEESPSVPNVKGRNAPNLSSVAASSPHQSARRCRSSKMLCEDAPRLGASSYPREERRIARSHFGIERVCCKLEEFFQITQSRFCLLSKGPWPSLVRDSMDGLTLSDRVDIVVVIRDRFSMFPRCLEALYAHTHVPFRAIVVAGGTDRMTRRTPSPASSKERQHKHCDRGPAFCCQAKHVISPCGDATKGFASF